MKLSLIKLTTERKYLNNDESVGILKAYFLGIPFFKQVNKTTEPDKHIHHLDRYRYFLGIPFSHRRDSMFFTRGVDHRY